MKIDKLAEDKNNGKVMLRIATDEVFANTIRRLILEEVPTMAVEDVELKDNSSALYDEMVAHRLGLTPIKTDFKSYNLPEKCKCEGSGCAQCQLQLTLKANKKGYVFAEEAVSADPKCTFVYPRMPIVKLLSKQKVDLTMTAVLGKGKDHIKWAPGWAYYYSEPVLKVGKVENPEEIMKKCSDGVFTLKGKKLEVNEDKVYTSELLELYAEMDSGITLEHTDKIIFHLESWGALPCKEILSKSAEILIEKIEEMESLI